MGQFQGSLAILIVLLILCWPAGLIYLLIKWQDAPAYPTTMCAYCGANIYQHYSACPYCGRPTGFSSPNNVPPPNTAPPFGSGACISCTATIRGTDQFCQYCGKKQW
jgi:predicted amidophosphoribosyltransferase